MFLKSFNSKSTQKPDKWGKFVWLAWVVAVFLMAGSTVRNIQRVIMIRAQLNEQKVEVEKIEAENQKLMDSISLSQKSDFIESEARNKLGLVKGGEISVVLPEEEILKKLAPQAQIIEEEEIETNWKQWLKLFL